MPGPSSSTVSTPSASRTVTVPPGGLHLAALSSRLVTARSRPAASPTTHQGSASTSKATPGRAAAYPGRRPGRRPRPGRPARRRGSAARRGPARRGRRSGWSAPRSGRGRRRAARRRASGGRPAAAPSAWASRSRLVRSEVSGVRSSWPASATSWRCRSREAASAASIWLNAVASRAISSSPSTGSGREVLGAGDVLDRGGEPADRAQAVAGDRPAGEPGGDHAGERRRAASRRRAWRAPAPAAPATGRCTSAWPVVGRARRPRGSGCRSTLMVRTLESSLARGDLELRARRACSCGLAGRGAPVAAVGVDEDDPDVGGAEHPRRAAR